MRQRIPKRYTILIACTGRAPITLTVQPLLVLALAAIAASVPITWVGKVVYSYAHKNSVLTETNDELTEQAQDILQQVEVLETKIDDLQERAGISGSSSNQSTPSSSDQSSTEMQPIARSQGGIGTPADAETLLTAAQSQLPSLFQDLRLDVQPALEKTLDREQARPQGIPVKVRGTEISSEFGLRPNPFGRGYEMHAGLDFTAAYGSPVYGTAPGIVVKAGWSAGGYGNHVVVEHGYGYRTLYAHMSALKATVGMKVERNTILGYLGNTGRSSGPHLHYSVYYNDQAVDPKNYLE